jgi:uncharacterized RDD family membrane protein YckC
MSMGDQIEGVYYSLADYAGLGRRLLILTIDGVLLFLAFITLLALYGFAMGPGSSIHLFMASYAVLCFMYLAVLARSRMGTIGYKLTGVRVVDLSGKRPSLACMTYRSLFAVLGPFNALLDLIWLSGDPYRQGLRDKLAGTYIIRRGAEPEGVGLQKHVMITLGWWSLLVREVTRKVT